MAILRDAITSTQIIPGPTTFNITYSDTQTTFNFINVLTVNQYNYVIIG